jgi:F-type H+-transporting ATPase subunit delta
MLQLAAAVSVDEAMVKVTSSARFLKEQITEIFLDLCGDALNKEAQNLVRILAENRRLGLIPEIAVVYEDFRAEAESTIDAEMVSAKPVSDEARNKIAQALKIRLGREVKLNCVIDESLLGGAIIRAGDMVIDGSAHGKLNRLASTMNH